ncbi:MAG: sigma-70 family RNA polymerase sigma factor [Oscillospiraceae bacterium]|nr:sigma-70 family RNA polymerase sigma factor [Oscillospiraceae bacterium]
MKIKYESSTGKPVEIEVSDYWGNIIIEFDREERNQNHKEMCGDRRGQTGSRLSLDAMEYEGGWFDAGVDLLRDLIRKEEHENLHRAVSELLPQQQKLVWRVHEDEKKIVDIAAEEGVTPQAIQARLKKIYAQLRKRLG